MVLTTGVAYVNADYNSLPFFKGVDLHFHHKFGGQPSLFHRSLECPEQSVLPPSGSFLVVTLVVPYGGPLRFGYWPL